MSKFVFDNSPGLKVLSEEQVKKVHKREHSGIQFRRRTSHVRVGSHHRTSGDRTVIAQCN